MIQSIVAFLGRALLSIIFISSAVHKFFDWDGTMQYFTQALNDTLALSIGSPFLQETLEWGIAHSFVLLLVGTLCELIGGLMVFLGLSLRLGALILFLFLGVATFLCHHFWLLQEPDRHMQMMNFMKNMSICGGLLYVLAMGKGVRCSPKPAPKPQTNPAP